MTMPYEPSGHAMAFSNGYDGGREPTLSPGLEAHSDRWNTLVQEARARGTGEVSQEPTSILQARSLSANGLGPKQAEQRMINGAPMPSMTGNGLSESTQQGYNMVKMIGGVA
jgi:hypothetical protein